MKTITVLYLAICILFSCCRNPAKSHPIETDDNRVIRNIAFMENISKNQKLNLSSVASDIEYCILETNKKCLITPNMSIYCSKEYILTINGGETNSACYIFDRVTGKFIRQISRRGLGPEEYLSFITSFWDEKNEQICALGNGSYIFYNIDGTISHKIYRKEHPFFSLGAIAYNDYYVQYIPNLSGNETKRIVFLDRTGVLIDTIPNFRTWKKTPDGYAGGIHDKFHVFQNELYYTDIFCDTLYQIKDFKLQPRYVFDTDNYKLPYQEHAGEGRYDLLAPIIKNEELVDRWGKYFVLDKILEDTNRLYITFDYRTKRYSAIYNKKENNLKILPPVSIHLPSKYRGKPSLYGFENDLDGGLPFWPQQMISDKEMMCVFPADKLLELDVSKITDEKLKNVLNSIEEESNPVVAIVTLKD